MDQFRRSLILGLGFLAIVVACQGPESDPDKHLKGRDPLDSLLGYYSGTLERLTCKEPLTDSCGLYETDTLPAQNLSLTRIGDTLVFFLQFGTFRVESGDTVFADSSDAVGKVSCIRIPEQEFDSGGPVYIVDVPVPSVGEANEIASTVCIDPDHSLSRFTIRAKNDPRFLREPLRSFRLKRVPPPLPD
jgi:hypothetical protein